MGLVFLARVSDDGRNYFSKRGVQASTPAHVWNVILIYLNARLINEDDKYK